MGLEDSGDEEMVPVYVYFSQTIISLRHLPIPSNLLSPLPPQRVRIPVTFQFYIWCFCFGVNQRLWDGGALISYDWLLTPIRVHFVDASHPPTRLLAEIEELVRQNRISLTNPDGIALPGPNTFQLLQAHLRASAPIHPEEE